MKREKLERLNLYMGIDTVQFKSKSAIQFNPEQFPFVRSDIVRKSDNSWSYYILNPDKGNNNVSIYNSYDYYRVMNNMLERIGLEEPMKTRIDFRFDSFDNNYNELLKLNKLLLVLLTTKYRINNRYKSQDLLTEEELTMRIQNKYIEAENYNKGLQEPEGDVMNRLELRSKSLNHDVSENDKELYEFYNWCDRLKRTVTATNFDLLVRKTNAALKDRYAEWTAKRGHRLSNFIVHYENCIYTMPQLIELIKILGYDNAEMKAKDYKRRYDIEFFSLKDLELYTDKIVESGANFFSLSDTERSEKSLFLKNSKIAV